MSTIVDERPEGILYRAAKTYPVPNLDILTLLFGTFPEAVSLESFRTHVLAELSLFISDLPQTLSTAWQKKTHRSMFPLPIHLMS